MKRSLGTVIALAALVLGAARVLAASPPLPGRDFPIGTINYETRVERETINLRRGEGGIRSLRFEVRQSDVEIREFRVSYDDGASESFRVNQLVRAGSSTRVYDLDSRRREVRSITVNYLPQGNARITLFATAGSPGPGPGPGPGPADWTRLGCKEVRFLVDRDTLKVGREGRFGALRLRVRNAAVEMFNLRVTYLSGVKQDVPVRELIPPNGSTRPIELLGRERGIDKIEMIYRSIPANKGSAEVCIDGLERF